MRQNPTNALRKARTWMSEAAVSLEHILAAETDASRDCRIEQQAPDIIRCLEHAISQLEDARQAFAPVEAEEIDLTARRAA